MNIDTDQAATIDEPAAETAATGPRNRHIKWRPNLREPGTALPAPAYGPRKPLREVRAELQAAKATEV